MRGLGRRAFTLVELITVIAIIGILLGAVLPGAAKMWSQRNEAGTSNMLRGLLLSARSQAIRTGGRGLFFYIDEEGQQRIVFIEADPPGTAPGDQDVIDCQADISEDYCITQPEAVNRYRVVPGKIYTIPAPYRVAADWSLDADPNSTGIWSSWPQQLRNDDFPLDTSGADTPRYHRNFFTVLFNVRGEMVVGQDAMIHDPNIDAALDPHSLGDVTRLKVFAVNDTWYQVGLNTPSNAEFTTLDADPKLFDMVILDDGRAANFRSVGGFVVYDESIMEGLLSVEMQSSLLSDGQPVYVSRYTGDVIFGPRGE